MINRFILRVGDYYRFTVLAYEIGIDQTCVAAEQPLRSRSIFVLRMIKMIFNQ